ncbi:MAG: S8 family serine peptidase [Anaerolineae bacterium]|nr:S8 family serine peptidase [Anaerolineae bacterium]
MRHKIRYGFTVMMILSLIMPFAYGTNVDAHQALGTQSATSGEQSLVISDWDDLPLEIRNKVDPRLLAELNGEIVPTHLGGGIEQVEASPVKHKPLEKTRFIVYLKAKADLEVIRQQRFTSRVAQRNAVFNSLIDIAQTTQGPVKTLLDTRMSTGDVAAYQSFYIFNGFAVEGGLDTIVELAQRADVERIVANYPKVYYNNNNVARESSPLNALGGLHADNWNIDLVDADRVWNELSVTGEGAVVAVYDSGADWDHPALMPRYRGYSLVGTNHNYHWFEMDTTLYAGGNYGTSLTTEPIVYGDHGTHVLGTMVGDGGTLGTQVGMAPGAQWIGIVDQLNGDYGDDISTHKAFQWLLAPTDLTGQLSTADPSKAPDVINCSWGIASPADDFLEPDIAALRTAGIAVVFAAGNPSADDGSIGSPGSAPSAITVGATDSSDTVASFSGRGPSFWEGEQKPEVTAPGVNIKSTLPGGGYSDLDWSGTSMAAPSVSGLVALLVSADLQDGVRDLDVDDIENFLTRTALDLGPAGFDYDYGYGRIDAYTVVRWALAAGDLQGTITDKSTGVPVAGAVVTGTKTNPGDTFTVRSEAAGEYATTVPAGLYNITVDAWGYNSAAYSGQTVVTGALSIKNFALTPLPIAQLTGYVVSGTTPISGALVYVDAHPETQFTTGTDGAYTLNLPAGDHAMTVEAMGYRVLHENVTVLAGGSTHDFSMTPAPTILLVEADRAFGWFVGNPVKNYIGWALDYENYLYDEWEIQYTTFTGTQVIAGSFVGYGVPTTTTLRTYDIVIWAHGGGDPPNLGYGGSPAQVNANDELVDYLNFGGKLFLSGQDIGYWEDGDGDLYDNYVRADLLSNTAASEGEATTGLDFLSGLDLELTDASLKNYPNGTTPFSPDAVAAQDGSAYSALDYDNGSGSAVLAVDPCDAGYRMVYVAAGLEAFAPRSGPIPEYAEMVDRSLNWLGGSKPVYGVKVSATPARQTDAPGNTVAYNVWVANTGATTDTFTMSVGGNLWATRILSDGLELTTTLTIPSCNTQDLTVEVDIPNTANTGDEDMVIITATGNASASADVTTIAFFSWQVESDAGSSADYWFAGAGIACTPYAIGGINFAGQTTLAYEGGQWVSKANKPTSFFGNGAAVIDDKIYVPGGFTDDTAGDWSPSDTLEIYDPASDTWSTGASMPMVRGGQSVAVANGKLYVFGGGPSTLFTDLYLEVWEYDPATDAWAVKGDMPYQMVFGGATSLNGKIYVGGDYRGYSDFYEYDPATDTWTELAGFPDGGRKDPILVGVDDKVYLYGGDNGYWGAAYATAFVYDLSYGIWSPISTNNYSHVAATGSFAGGRLWAYGDDDGSWGTESLKLTDAFCLSDKIVAQNTVQPGDRITYTIEIHSDAVALTAASVADPVPAGTTWAGFGDNPAGATYNAGQDQVEWGGSLAAGADPLTFTFGVDVAPAGWTNDDIITNAVVFDSGTGLVFPRTTTTVIRVPDPAPSTKIVNEAEALAGDVLTYIVHVENSIAVTDTFIMVDPIPANTTYIPGSLTYTLGTAGYDPMGDVITWTNDLPGIGYVPVDYAWGDSDGNGTVGGVISNWVEIGSTGAVVNLGDDATAGPFPIGFNFDFYENTYSEFYVSSNGYLAFGSGSSSLNNTPIPSISTPDNIIALMWDDLDPGDTNDPVYYETFASCPVGSGQCLVVQYDDFCHFAGGVSCDIAGTFEAILYASGDILIQFEDSGVENGSGSTTGIENDDGTAGVEYAYNASVLHDDLAILFQPILGPIPRNFADITFAVTTNASLPANTWITNTATISGPFNSVRRSAGTLVNSIDLGASTKTVDKTWVAPGDAVTYDFVLVNTGLQTATAVLTDPIPAHTTYIPGSVACDGICAYDAGLGAITWNGDIVSGSPVTLTFAVTLIDALVDLTPVTNTATLNDGSGTLYQLADTFIARSPDLSASFKQVTPAQVYPGDTVTYTVYIRNTGFAAGDARMRDELPPSLTYEGSSLSCGNGSCGESGGTITWTGTIPGRGMIPIQFRATVSAGAGHGDVITNTAIITDVSWNVDYPVEAPVMVVEPVDWWLTKDGPASVGAGAMLVYTLTYGNDGPFNAVTAAQVIDTLPAGARYVGASPANVYDDVAGTVTWDVGVLNAGVSGTLVLTISTPMMMPATVLTNTASITATPQDSELVNNTGIVTTQIIPNAEFFGLLLAPVQAKHYGGPGAAVNYTLEVMNTGNITDTFDVTFSGNIWTTAVNAMTIGPLFAGNDDNLVVTVDVPGSAMDGDTDTVTVTVTSRGDPDQSTSARLTTEASAVHGVNVTPNADTQSGDPGETLTYILRVENTGSAQDTFSVMLMGNTWPTMTAPTSVGPLAPGAMTDTQVIVTIPEGATGAETDSVDFIVTSQADSTKSAKATLVTVAKYVFDLQLRALTTTGGGQPDAMVTYTLQITNTGNTTEVFDIATHGVWATTAATVVGPLAIHANTSIEVVVHIPAGAVDGDVDVTTVTVTSRGDPTVSKIVTLTTQATKVGWTVYLPLLMRN